MKWLYGFIGVLLFVTTSIASEPLYFVAVEDVYPFAYQVDGNNKGYDYNIFMEIMKRAGYRVTVDLLPFKRTWNYLKKGTADGTFMLYYKEERRQHIVYCDTPIHVATFHLFVRSGHEFPFKTIKDLYGKRVGNQLGFSVTPEFDLAVKENRIILDEALSVEMNLKKLLAGRLDCYISSKRLLTPFIRRMGIEGAINALPTPILPEKGLYLAVSRKSKNILDIDAFLKKVSAIRNELDRDGTIKRFDERYFPFNN